MEKEFIPYEQALALKKLGYDKGSYACIIGDGFNIFDTIVNYNINPKFPDYYDIPLYQQAFRWFREKYFLEKQPLYINENTWRVTDQEEILMKNTKILQNIHTYKDYSTHEEAELACLKKLIEIVKNK